MSSRKYRDGCGCDNWVHVVGPVCGEMLLTEGEMKADIIHHLSGQSVIAVPGVNSLAQLRDTLLELRSLGLRKLMTAFDIDFLNRWPVQNGYWNLMCLLDELGFEFGTYLWMPD